MNAYVAFPAANTSSANDTLAKWHERGYWSAVFIDAGQEKPDADIVIEAEGDYPGFPKAANLLCRECVKAGADVVVLAGDDIDPDLSRDADELLKGFVLRFPDLFGVMQPTGDAYGGLAPGNTTPSAVSPWIGSAFIQRSYGGRGPYYEGYRDLWDDAELWAVADMLGAFHAEPSITQYHRHWSRGCPDLLASEKRKRICASEIIDRRLFFERRACGFPGCALAAA